MALPVGQAYRASHAKYVRQPEQVHPLADRFSLQRLGEARAREQRQHLMAGAWDAFCLLLELGQDVRTEGPRAPAALAQQDVFLVKGRHIYLRLRIPPHPDSFGPEGDAAGCS